MHIPAIVDARKRLLRPGGVQIARSDRLWAAPVDMPDKYKKLVQGHYPNEFGVNLESAQRYTSNSLRKISATEDELLARPECWGTLDYAKIESSDHEGHVSWTMARNGVCHGIVGWFDCMLIDGVMFPAPGLPELILARSFSHGLNPCRFKGGMIKACIRANWFRANMSGGWIARSWRPGMGQARIAFQQSVSSPASGAHQLLQRRPLSFQAWMKARSSGIFSR